MILTLADFESIDNLLIQKFVDYDLIKLKLDELNKKLMDYSVFSSHKVNKDGIFGCNTFAKKLIGHILNAEIVIDVNETKLFTV